MRARLSVGATLFLIALTYAASPYVALWRLEAALDRGDTLRLEAGVDWRSVREGLKQDIADGVIGPVSSPSSSSTLPQFGASFIAGIANTMIEHEVTPQNLIAVMRQMRSRDTSPSMMDSFNWAFFDGPTSFNVVVKTAGGDDEDCHLRLRLELHHGVWRVMRAWIPQDMVERAAHRT